MPGETSWGKSTIEQVLSASRSVMPRTTAALARMWPLPMALERIRTSALLFCEVMVALYCQSTASRSRTAKHQIKGGQEHGPTEYRRHARSSGQGGARLQLDR